MEVALENDISLIWDKQVEEIKKLIDEAGNKQWQQFEASELIKSGNPYRCTIVADGKKAILDFYFNGDGKTTINPSSGKNSELKVKIAEYLKKELTSVVDTKNTLTIRDIGEVEFTELIELMSKDDLNKFESIVLKESTNEYVKSK